MVEVGEVIYGKITAQQEWELQQKGLYRDPSWGVVLPIGYSITQEQGKAIGKEYEKGQMAGLIERFYPTQRETVTPVTSLPPTQVPVSKPKPAEDFYGIITPPKTKLTPYLPPTQVPVSKPKPAEDFYVEPKIVPLETGFLTGESYPYAKEIGSVAITAEEAKTMPYGGYGMWIAESKDIPSAIREGEYASEVITPTFSLPFYGKTRGELEYQEQQVGMLKTIFRKETEAIAEREMIIKQFESAPEQFKGALGVTTQEGTTFTLGKEYFETLPKYKEYKGLFGEGGYLGEDISQLALIGAKEKWKLLPQAERRKAEFGEEVVALGKTITGFGEFSLSIGKTMLYEGGVQTGTTEELAKGMTTFGWHKFEFGGKVGAFMQTPTVQPSVKFLEHPLQWTTETLRERPAVTIPVVTTAALLGYGISKGKASFLATQKVYGTKAAVGEVVSSLSPIRISQKEFIYKPSAEPKILFESKVKYFGEGGIRTIKATGVEEPIRGYQQQIFTKVGEGKFELGMGKTQVVLPSVKYIGGKLYGGFNIQQSKIVPITKGGFVGRYAKGGVVSTEELLGGRGVGISQKEWGFSLFETPKGYVGEYSLFYGAKPVSVKVIGVGRKISETKTMFMGGKETPIITRITKEGVFRTIRTKPTIRGFEEIIGVAPEEGAGGVSFIKGGKGGRYATLQEQKAISGSLTESMGGMTASIKNMQSIIPSMQKTGQIVTAFTPSATKQQFLPPKLKEKGISAVSFSIKGEEKLITKQKDILMPKTRVMDIQKQFQFQPQMQTPIQMTGLKQQQTLKQQLKQLQMTEPITAQTTTFDYGFKFPTPFVPIGFPPLLPFSTEGRRRSQAKGRGYKYTPSLAALGLNIKTFKIPSGTWTGITTRPIIKSRRRKR